MTKDKLKQQEAKRDMVQNDYPGAREILREPLKSPGWSIVITLPKVMSQSVKNSTQTGLPNQGGNM
jgi:hypothetical protein